MHHHAAVKGKFILVPFIPQKVLKVRTFPDIFDQFFIRYFLFLFDDECASRNPHWQCRSSIVCDEERCITRFYFVPRDEVGKYYPAILSVELASEDHIEFLEFGFFFRYPVHREPFKCTGF